MANGKNSFLIYTDWISIFEGLDDDEAGRLIKHLFRYVNDLNPEPTDKITKIAFEPLKLHLKRDLVKWTETVDKNSKNGKLGGRPKKPNETQKTHRFSEKPKKADNDNDNDSVNVKEKVIKEKNHLFLESDIFNKEIFRQKLTGTQYELANIDYYHEVILNWSDSKNEKKINWLAAAKGWMARDMKEGKFVDKNFKSRINGSEKLGTSDARLQALAALK